MLHSCCAWAGSATVLAKKCRGRTALDPAVCRAMTEIIPPRIREHAPHETQLGPITPARRVLCGVVGGALLIAAVSMLGLAAVGAPARGFFFLGGLWGGFGGLVLLGSALFPRFTLARKPVDPGQ